MYVCVSVHTESNKEELTVTVAVNLAIFENNTTVRFPSFYRNECESVWAFAHS